MLTDTEAEQLLFMIKHIAKSHSHVIDEKGKGEFEIIGSNNVKFKLNYHYTINSKIIHIRECVNDYTLIRINLNNKFHKNADGEIIRGNRVNIFSEQEYYDKNDGKTHYKCYPLPYESISNSDDFLKVLDELYSFTNTHNADLVSISIQEKLV